MSTKGTDYRAFMFAILDEYGMLLLHCTRKPKKGPHFQLPGGHIDAEEFDAATKLLGGSRSIHDRSFNILLLAAKIAAARELWEETGLDIRNHLDRLTEAPLKPPKEHELTSELENRIYFYLQLKNDDFTFMRNPDDLKPASYVRPMNVSKYPLPLLLLSEEHSGFMFEPNPEEAVRKLVQHSSGVGSRALTMAMLNNK